MAKKEAKKVEKADVEEVTTVGGVDPNAPPLPEWQRANNPSPAEQRAQSVALDAERAAQPK
jgi:hypothetical protein